MTTTTPIKPQAEQLFVTWHDEKSKAIAMAQASQGLADNAGTLRRRSHATNVFHDVGGSGMHGKDGFNRGDYEQLRLSEAMPTKPKDVMSACNRAYKRVGIVRNVIDLMADFATQGIDLYHPNEKIEEFYREWFRRVRGRERSERFLNYLYRIGNVVCKRSTAKLPTKVEDQMRRAKAAPDTSIEPDVVLLKHEIPWKYTFLNPINIEIANEELSAFVDGDGFTIGITLPQSIVSKIRRPKNQSERDLVDRLPPEFILAVKNGQKFVELDREKVKTAYYKRDDWEPWASPMVTAILVDLQILDKMKLADLAALDGAISCIRVWKLGNIENKIMPTGAAINKLAEMLMNNVGGGVMDLVWGPDLELIETSTEVHRFLGSGKYEPCLTQIYAGLGIPPTLTGASSSGGFTNNFISLKTLTERLEYGRGILADFWAEEVRLVQVAMGFKQAARVVFDRMTLSDEAAEKQLLLNLWDRGLVSDESIVDRFGEVPDVEESRIRRDDRKRKNGRKAPKASPFHDPQQDFRLKTVFAQAGEVTPSEVGLELDERKPGEISPIERKNKQESKLAATPRETSKTVNKTKVGAPGRPKQSNDKKKRKQKAVKPRSSASFLNTLSWAENAQAAINAIASPAYLASLSKANARQLTDEESNNFEQYKFFVLCKLAPNQTVDKQQIGLASASDLTAPGQVFQLLKATVDKHTATHGKPPALETLRRYQAGVVALWHSQTEPESQEAV